MCHNRAPGKWNPQLPHSPLGRGFVNYTNGNIPFMKPTARTCKDAFGSTFDEGSQDSNADKWDAGIFWLAVFVLLFIFVILPLFPLA